jgi:hypothetical protein
VALVVGVAAGEVADGGLALRLDERLVGLDVEERLRGVAHLPDDDGRDVDRVADEVVDLERLAVERVRAQRDLALGGERVRPPEAGAALGAAVGPEEDEDAGVVRADDEEAAEDEDERDEEPEAGEDADDRRGDVALDGADRAKEPMAASRATAAKASMVKPPRARNARSTDAGRLGARSTGGTGAEVFISE